MTLKLLYFLLVVIYLATECCLMSEMAQSHHDGAADAKALLGGVQNAAKQTAASQVPGFKTDSPSQASLDDGSIGGAMIAASHDNQAASMIKDNSRTRQKFVIDPNTDPMVMNGNKAQADPLKAMKEGELETIVGVADKDEIHECLEGGDEYQQTCHKNRVVRIRVIPEIKKEFRWCPGHPSDSISEARRYDHDQLEWCGNPCRSRIDTTQERKVEIIQDEWVDGCVGLESQSDEGLCRYETHSLGGPETRTITGPVVNPEQDKPNTDSEPITRDSWRESYTYTCLKKVKGNCEKLRSKGCLQIKSECTETIGGVCVAWRQTYSCPSKKQKKTRYKTTGDKSPFCLTGDCTGNDYEANGELLDAMSQLAVLKEMQNDIRANQLEIFKGQIRKCSKNCAGFRDCCTTGKGWGVSFNLSSCSGEEKELAQWREKKRCVFVGTYCAEKMLGKCTRKRSSFCCFGNKLAKLLNEQGKRQLGIGWGDAKGPDCRGLSPEELSRIDMSKMDLSELYEEVQANFKPKTQDHMAQGIELERIKENMSRMAGKVKMPAQNKNTSGTQAQQQGQSL